MRLNPRVNPARTPITNIIPPTELTRSPPAPTFDVIPLEPVMIKTPAMKITIPVIITLIQIFNTFLNSVLT